MQYLLFNMKFKIRFENYPENFAAKHFVSLQSTIFDENYGQLISSLINLSDNNYCLSMWIYVRQFSKGYQD